jgi:hypothetical protein
MDSQLDEIDKILALFAHERLYPEVVKNYGNYNEAKAKLQALISQETIKAKIEEIKSLGDTGFLSQWDTDRFVHKYEAALTKGGDTEPPVCPHCNQQPKPHEGLSGIEYLCNCHHAQWTDCDGEWRINF